MRRVLTPRWVAVHIGCFLLAALFFRLGWWQWQRSQSATGGAQNFLYALEWPIFAIAGLVMWWRTVRDEVAGRGRGAARSATGSPGDPSGGDAAAGGDGGDGGDGGTTGTDGEQSALLRAVAEERRVALGPAGDRAEANRDARLRMIAADEAEDPEVAAYNAWLGSLAREDQAGQGRMEAGTAGATGAAADGRVGRDR